MPEVLLRMCAVEKSFGGVRALKPTHLELMHGEILGLVGENGAGKSTLIRLLSGVHPPDGGGFERGGLPVRFSSPRDAIDAGVATIHQELEYFSSLSVAENMLMGESWPRRRWGGVDWNRLHYEARRRLNAFGLEISTHQFLERLTAAEKQEIALAAALARDAQLLILDEPTASLTEPEVDRLFAHLKRLRSQGVTILYVSHRLDEIFRITDRVAVLRDGQLVAVHQTGSVTADRLVHDMVGRPLEQVYPRSRGNVPGQLLLEVENVSRAGMFRDVSFGVRAGEIVGLAGLVGAGRSELARAIYGMYGVDTGQMRLNGQPWSPLNPHEALRSGLVYVPEERKRHGLVLDHSLSESISIGFSDLMSRFGLISHKRETAGVLAALRAYDIRSAGPKQPVGMLSGGNQQKALLARWLERQPDVILLDEPTRGVDVGAKAQIHALIDRMANAGKAIVFISSDLPEVLGMSDRILVMNRGRISAELRGEMMTQQNVILAASGLYAGGVR
ncbi:MAG: sugar ABC transporter ATP-binding protein [Planctomycetaceae bacterium]